MVVASSPCWCCDTATTTQLVTQHGRQGTIGSYEHEHLRLTTCCGTENAFCACFLPLGHLFFNISYYSFLPIFPVSLCFSLLPWPPAIAPVSGAGEIARFVLHLPVSPPRQPLRTVVDADPAEEERTGRQAGTLTLFPLLRQILRISV